MLFADFDREAFDKLALKQEYWTIRKAIFPFEKLSVPERMKVIPWVFEKAEEGHIPMMGFIVRDYKRTNFNMHDSKVLEAALRYKLISEIRFKQDLACCTNFHLRYYNYAHVVLSVIDSYFDQVIISPLIYENALNSTLRWFIGRDLVEDLPSPTWLAICPNDCGWFSKFDGGPFDPLRRTFFEENFTLKTKHRESVIFYDDSRDIHLQRAKALWECLAEYRSKFDELKAKAHGASFNKEKSLLEYRKSLNLMPEEPPVQEKPKIRMSLAPGMLKNMSNEHIKHDIFQVKTTVNDDTPPPLPPRPPKPIQPLPPQLVQPQFSPQPVSSSTLDEPVLNPVNPHGPPPPTPPRLNKVVKKKKRSRNRKIGIQNGRFKAPVDD